MNFLFHDSFFNRLCQSSVPLASVKKHHLRFSQQLHSLKNHITHFESTNQSKIELIKLFTIRFDNSIIGPSPSNQSIADCNYRIACQIASRKIEKRTVKFPFPGFHLLPSSAEPNSHCK